MVDSDDSPSLFLASSLPLLAFYSDDQETRKAVGTDIIRVMTCILRSVNDIAKVLHSNVNRSFCLE